jgi:hypothetical protein
MNAEPTIDRDAELRRMLVTTVSATPLLRPRPRPRVVVGAIVAFIVAGALTGGAVASASASSSGQNDSLDSIATAAHASLMEHNATLIGAPITRQTNSPTAVGIGTAPRGANAVVVGFVCLDAGSYSIQANGKYFDSVDCTSATVNSPTADIAKISGNTPLTYSFDSTGNGRYAVWVAFAHVRKVTPSFAQQNAMLGGRITRDEYVEAFSRYIGCMDAAGFDLGTSPVDAPDLAVNGLPGEAVASGADVRCGEREFNQVEARWQAQGLK